MPKGELGRLRRNRLALILSNLSIVGLILLSLPLVLQFLAVFIMSIFASIICVLLVVFTLGFIFIGGTDVISNLFQSIVGSVSDVHIEGFALVGLIALAVNIVFLALSIVLFLMDRRQSHKGRFVFNIVMAILSVGLGIAAQVVAA